MKRAPSLSRAACLATMFLLASCASAPSVSGVADISKLEMDPQKFVGIALREDIEIGTAVIRGAAAAMSRRRWVALQYVEQENRKGFVPERESEYANLFLVRELEGGDGEEGIVRDRYLVVDLWHYYPRDGIKTCHEWKIWEDDVNSRPARASFRLLVEDFHNVFLGERHASLEPQTIERLGDFYLKVNGFFARRVKDRRVAMRPPDTRELARASH